MLDVDKAQTNTTSPFFPGLGNGDFHWLSATREISIRVPHGLTKGIEHSIAQPVREFSANPRSNRGQPLPNRAQPVGEFSTNPRLGPVRPRFP
eukprot:COSAG02_NODE_9251_length_2277_cov_2.493572_3_plen_93_part_00